MSTGTYPTKDTNQPAHNSPMPTIVGSMWRSNLLNAPTVGLLLSRGLGNTSSKSTIFGWQR